MHKLQHCLGERGKGGKIKADCVNCPKNFVPHCSLCDVGVRGEGGGGTLRGEFELCGRICVCLFYRAKLLNKVSVLLKTTPITVNIAYKICQLDTSKDFQESIIVNLTPAETFMNLLF